mmetsp:Transcript_65302/g.211514  ORF Transcript_65302/g.211514 Transcript_65302/m.211514 type:complete len:259 (+) Transcript_65302:99-875(+)
MAGSASPKKRPASAMDPEAPAAGCPELRVDHLVFVVPELDAGVADFERLTGVRPCMGGRHVGIGTHNALVSLGEGVYLELLAKDPTQEESKTAAWLGVDSSKACLTTFCACPANAADQLDRVATSSKDQSGYDVGPIRDMSRHTPVGKLLRWRLAAENHKQGVAQLPEGGLVPFLIDWSLNELPHPSETSPSGCRLVALRAQHPDPSAVEKVLVGLGATSCFSRDESSGLCAASGPTPKLEVVLETPKGLVTLSGDLC